MGRGADRRLASAALLAAAATACGPLDGPRDVLIIARGDDGGYGLHPREIDADDLRTLRGPVVKLLARPTVVIDVDGVATIHGGEPLDIEYASDGDHLVPLDYEGLVAASAYHHLHQAGAYFRSVGLAADLEVLETLYQPLTDYGGTVGPYEYHDNAAFMPSIHAFLLLEERWLDYVPLAANEGIMAHEFAHAVFHHLAGGPRPDWDLVSRNLWRSINEGLADVHAAALTNDPAFARASAGRFVFNRDVSGESIALTAELAATIGDERYNPYPVGTVLAAVFWDYRAALVAEGHDPVDASRAMGELAFRSVERLAVRADGFALADVASAMVAETDGPGERAICDALRARLLLGGRELVGCL